jgi:hypothetical protein
VKAAVRLIRSDDLAPAPYAHGAAGARLADVVSTRSALIGVTVFGYEDQLVEIEAVAALRPAGSLRE